MFRARKYIWQFSVYSWNHEMNCSAEKCDGPDECQGKVHVEHECWQVRCAWHEGVGENIYSKVNKCKNWI